MNCPDEANLIDRLAGEIGEEEASRLHEHLAQCENCAGARQSLDDTRRVLQIWEAAPLPDGLHDRVMATFRQRASRPAFATLAERLWFAVRPALCGGALALLWLVFQSRGNPVGSPGVMLACGVVWGVTYSSIFQMIFTPRVRQSILDVSTAALAGLAAFCFAITLAVLTPNPPSHETRAMFAAVSQYIPEWVAWILPAAFTLLAVGAMAFALARLKPCEGPLLAVSASLIFCALMTLDLWVCHLLDPGNISIPMTLFWIASVWFFAPGIAWSVVSMALEESRPKPGT